MFYIICLCIFYAQFSQNFFALQKKFFIFCRVELAKKPKIKPQLLSYLTLNAYHITTTKASSISTTKQKRANTIVSALSV
ncbi:MAG: hypothetical protein IKC35_02550, partial [Clostridia bacterium]|nr:hypothetical protein [Clostridia bacterium]